MQPNTIIAHRIIITGRVQGVGFRAFVLAQAQALGLDGFVRNRRDGSVEALAKGEAAKVEALIAQCRKGPPASRVDSVDIADAQGVVDTGFKHLPTV
jgi:acylphosphatase